MYTILFFFSMLFFVLNLNIWFKIGATEYVPLNMFFSFFVLWLSIIFRSFSPHWFAHLLTRFQVTQLRCFSLTSVCFYCSLYFFYIVPHIFFLSSEIHAFFMSFRYFIFLRLTHSTIYMHIPCFHRVHSAPYTQFIYEEIMQYWRWNIIWEYDYTLGWFKLVFFFFSTVANMDVCVKY